MPLPEFDELPFNVRPDLSPYLIHLTKNTEGKNGKSAFDNLIRILKRGELIGSTTKSGFIKGKNPATCFMDVPFVALKYVLSAENTNPDNPRYEPFGIFVTKRYAYNNGCRPVLYLSDSETEELGIPDKELWRVVRFEVQKKGWISWLHERAWRCRGDFPLPEELFGVLVRDTNDAKRLREKIEKDKKSFAALPRSIIPLNVVCQGLLPTD
jgi:hypothetical protein